MRTSSGSQYGCRWRFWTCEAAAALLLACMPAHAVMTLRKQTRLAQPLSIGATASARIELEADETCSQRV
ncbi:hypothetical protein TB9_14390 [Xanthomonas perforans]|uniref:Uncharacterized protein n=2 Tax=Xanthomonas perforans TaxID=442694 RepID=A0AAQ1BUF5_XANPE|nr:hypothetical protein [Xanthomonas perforans]AQS77152.1 hypothetical protein XPE_13565 [Xanthomonas perforans 91-118]TKA15138.1 hypothetical protein TP41_17565 [Xanthomonas euvesicatoria pv. citrumelonis]APP00707.1 hypothetical protein BJD13_17915 [Xanthomonas perforans]KLC00855.1 hypothetical protein XP420_22665 [Xanthomonas perforans]KLC03597.1 hypothetical protein XP315_16830 [Xanthomonas perforans]